MYPDMRKSIAIIGEGITEKYYIESLKGMSPFSILPRELNRKASSLDALEKHIKKSINDGYDEVYCIIDMDGKISGKANIEYLKIKGKYHNIVHGKKSKGIQCEVVFIETERCTELWFLYYFLKNTTTRKFNSYKEIEAELRKYRPNYEKSEKYFKSVGNLHKEFTEQKIKGSLFDAVKNSRSSIVSKEKDDRNYTYSEMHILLERLKIPTSY